MTLQNFTRSKSLNTIPPKKQEDYLNQINLSTLTSEQKRFKTVAILRYSESNIPVEYWDLKMEDFKGDSRLLKKYNEYIEDLKLSYQQGLSLCFSGSHGRGKTMTVSNILKKACEKGYSTLYTTLSDIVNVLT